MVSGWDRNPGSKNNYASPPLTKREAVGLSLFVVMFYGVIIALLFG